MAELTPWPARAASSTQKSLAAANANVDTDISTTPATVARFGPSRSAQCPTGTAVTRTAAL